MERIEINATIKKIKKEGINFIGSLELLNNTDPEKYPDTYEELVIRNYYLLETMSMKMRKLIFSNAKIAQERIMKETSKIQGIEVTVDDSHEIINIKLPALLPKKKGVSSNLFEPFYNHLENCFSNINFEKLSESVICFLYHYDEKTSQRVVKDYDNYEQKRILDILATFILKDDCSKNMDLFQSTIPSSGNFTNIIIFTKNRFSNFISENNSLDFLLKKE